MNDRIEDIRTRNEKIAPAQIEFEWLCSTLNWLCDEVDRLRKLMPICDQCGEPYLDRACGPTHAALAEPMRRPGEAQKNRLLGETAEAEVQRLRDYASQLEVLHTEACEQIRLQRHELVDEVDRLRAEVRRCHERYPSWIREKWDDHGQG